MARPYALAASLYYTTRPVVRAAAVPYIYDPRVHHVPLSPLNEAGDGDTGAQARRQLEHASWRRRNPYPWWHAPLERVHAAARARSHRRPGHRTRPSALPPCPDRSLTRLRGRCATGGRRETEGNGAQASQRRSDPRPSHVPSPRWTVNSTPRPGRSHTSMTPSLTVGAGSPLTMSYHEPGSPIGYARTMSSHGKAAQTWTSAASLRRSSAVSGAVAADALIRRDAHDHVVAQSGTGKVRDSHRVSFLLQARGDRRRGRGRDGRR